ncbi:hypothetical protein C4D60_Mb04t36110 [Musa balbisiana]|uniref:Uncharacterized protein n=1 Tax=Musa balbisiana TaxID=52838 RepID=A0A4V4HAA1_MUSBA|nr:hypothetical protein C4D60_Mb04t36110 [Musa balbisiana]
MARLSKMNLIMKARHANFSSSLWVRPFTESLWKFSGSELRVLMWLLLYNGEKCSFYSLRSCSSCRRASFSLKIVLSSDG